MRSLTVIIPSKTASNFRGCYGAVKQFNEEAEIVLINDGVSPLPIMPDLNVIPGVRPFCFARNVNLGIQARPDSDVVILNDDAILETPGGFSLLQRAAEENPEYGIIAATTNITGNPNQKPKGIGLREEPRIVPFIAVLLPRRTIERVGLLDERFGGLDEHGRPIYGFEDNDYCRRVRKAGLKIGIHDGCFVDHGKLRPTFRGEAHAPGDTRAGARLYLAKWRDELEPEELQVIQRMAA